MAQCSGSEGGEYEGGGQAGLKGQDESEGRIGREQGKEGRAEWQ